MRRAAWFAAALFVFALLSEGCTRRQRRRMSRSSSSASSPSRSTTSSRRPPRPTDPLQLAAPWPEEGQGLQQIGKLGRAVHPALLSPGARYLANVGNDLIDVIDLRERRVLPRIDCPGSKGGFLFFSADEQLLAHASNKKLQVFSLATGKSVASSELPRAPDQGFFTADGSAVELYFTRRETFRAGEQPLPAEKREIEVATGKVRATGPFAALPPTPAWWSSDQRRSRDGRLSLATRNRRLVIADRLTGEPLRDFLGDYERSALHPSEQRLATVNTLASLVIHDTQTGAELAKRERFCRGEAVLRFTPSGENLFAWCNEKLQLLDAATLEVVEDFGQVVRFGQPAFAADGSAVYFHSGYGQVSRIGPTLVRHERAREDYRKALDEAEAKSGEPEAAEKAWRAAIEVRPGKPEAHLGLARIFLKAGRRADLEAAYGAAKKRGGKDDAIEAALIELRESSLARDLTPRPSILAESGDRPFLVVEQGRHTARVSRVLYTRDGKAIVTASWDKTIRVWDAKTFQLLRTLRVPAQPGSEGQIFTMALSPDQRFVAAAGYSVGAGDVKRYVGDYVVLLDFLTGKVVGSAFSHKQAIFALAFSHDGRKLVSGGGVIDQQAVVHEVEESGKLKRVWSARYDSLVTDLAFDPDNERIYTAEYGGAIGRSLPPSGGQKPRGELVALNPLLQMMLMTRRPCPPGKCAFHAMALSPDGSELAGGMATGGLGIYDPNGNPGVQGVARQKMIRNISLPGEGPIGSLAYNSDGSRLAVARGRQVFVVDAKEGKEPLATFSGHDNTVFSASFSPDGARIVSSSANHVFVWDASSAEVVGQPGGASGQNRIWSVAAGRAKPQLVGFGWNQDGEVAKNKYGKVHKAFDFAALRVVPQADPAEFAPVPEGAEPDFQGDMITGQLKSWARLADESVLLGTEYAVYRRPKGVRQLKELSKEGIAAFAVSVSADGQTLYAGLVDGRVQIFDAPSNKLVATLYVAPDEEWILWTPDGWYAASRNGARTVGWNVGGANPLAMRLGLVEAPQFYPFEQFDLRLNRPDYVLARLGGAGKRRLGAIAAGVARRWKKMGLSEAALSSGIRAPSLQLGDVPPTTRKKKVKLSVKAQDATYPLSRLNVWVNDVPLLGASGEKLEAKELERVVEVELTAGRNKIQVSVLNGAGIESLKETRYATYQGRSPKPVLHVLAVGVSDYAADAFKLRYAAKDAQDVAALAEKAGKGPFKKVLVHRVVDREATREGILAAKEKLQASKVDDEVIVFFAGHGLLDEKLDYWFATADMDFEKPGERGLLYEEVEGLLDGIAARKKLLLVDTCHSGEVDKDAVEVVAAAGEAQGPTVKARAVGTRGIRKKLQGAEAAVQGLGDAIGELFQDLRRGSGAMVISSAGGAEYALESSEWNNGVFTFAVLDGLGGKSADRNGDGRVQVSELRDHVSEVVKRLTAGKQTPTARRENLEFDFPVF